MDNTALWRRYQDWLCECPDLGIRLDVSRMDFDEGFVAQMADGLEKALAAMKELEAGAIANPDEGRMVGHYWLRAPELAPTEAIRDQIAAARDAVLAFAADVRAGRIHPRRADGEPQAPRFTDVLLVGIGGSALGPQLAVDALGGPRDRLRLHFLDNTDPDGFDRVFAAVGPRLKATLVVAVSKSGATLETRNGVEEVRALCGLKGLNFPGQAVAVTVADSPFDKQAVAQQWLARFPTWDFVGGRTSISSAVGLLPMALQGLDVGAFLDGAAAMDRLTRQAECRRNPAALMALAWYSGCNGQGDKDLVVLPYKDRLLLLPRYLQQLIMESLGKRLDLDGSLARQGLTVYGNKGSTDQHAYVQQLRDGVPNFFVNFIVVNRDRAGAAGRHPPAVHKASAHVALTSGDYLLGFWQGTRAALYESGRRSYTIILDELTPRSLGALIALYERTVGLYARLIHVNAYDQPGVDAGKKAATAVLDLQAQAVELLEQTGEALSADDLAARLNQPDAAETIHHALTHLAANRRLVAQRRGKFRYKPEAPRGRRP